MRLFRYQVIFLRKGVQNIQELVHERIYTNIIIISLVIYQILTFYRHLSILLSTSIVIMSALINLLICTGLNLVSYLDFSTLRNKFCAFIRIISGLTVK